MTRLEAHAQRAGDRARRRAVERLAVALTADLPELHVRIDGDRVTITGHGVLDDVRLIWIGSILR